MKKLFIISASIFLLAAGCNTAKPQTNNQPPPQAATTPPVADVRPWFTQTVEGSNFNQPKTQFTVGQTALEVLDATHQITVKDYGSMGKFVLSIDGIKPDSKHFWEFFVNGKSSNVGASAYVLKDNDKVEWKLSAISSSGQ